MIRVACLGCGAVTQKSHLPALRKRRDVRVTHFVDINEASAREAAGDDPDAIVSTDAKDLLGNVDAVVVALPHHLHEALSVPLLEAGIHGFIEKPMALTAASCDRMLAAAASGGATIMVGLARRWFDSHRMLHRLLEREVLGPLRGFRIEEGAPYGWPVSSGFMFDKAQAGGGVLFDSGAHVVDALLWWFGDLDILDVEDDARGGIEAESFVRMRTQDGVEGTMLLSRTRLLDNAIVIEGERGTLRMGIFDGKMRMTWGEGVPPLIGEAMPDQGATHVFEAQMDAWIRALDGGVRPPVSGEVGRASVAWIEQCYARSKSRDLHVWERAPDADCATPATAGKEA